jgi:hypothetical protein
MNSGESHKTFKLIRSPLQTEFKVHEAIKFINLLLSSKDNARGQVLQRFSFASGFS